MQWRTLAAMMSDSWLRPLQWWWLDLPLAAVTVIVASSLAESGTGVDLLGQLSLVERREVYTDLLQLSTIFAGFGGVVFAIYLGFQSRRIRLLKEQVGKLLLHIWLAAILTPWMSAFALVVARITDRGGVASPNFARWLACAAIIVVLIQLARIVWVFYQLAMIDMKPQEPTIRTANEPPKIRRRAS